VQNEAPKSRRERFRLRRRRTLIATAVLFAVLFTAASASALWLKGRELIAPEWLKARIAQQIETALPEAQVRFGDVVAVVDENWLPQFFVRDLEWRTRAGEHVVTLTNVSAGIDANALMQRRLSLSSLRVNGVFVTLRRDQFGAFTLSSGTDAGSVTQAAPTLAQLIAELDEFFLRPAMVSLREVDVRAVTLRYEDARSARGWTVDGGRMRVLRDGMSLQAAADLAILGGRSNVATLEANYSGIIGETASEFGITLDNLDTRDIASQSAAFSWLSTIQAPISGALRGGVDNDGGLKPLSATLQIGAGVIQPAPEARPIPIEGVRSYFTYTPDTQSLRFDQFDIDGQWGRGNLEGLATMVTHKSGRLEQLVGQFRLNELSVNPADIYPQPVEIEAAELDFRLSLEPFALQLGRVDITDRGRVLTGRGEVSVGEKGWAVAMDGELDGIAVDRVKELWPVSVKPKTRKWIGENVRAGRITDASAAVRLAQGDAPKLYLSFDFADANARFLRHMPLIKNGKGHASLVKDRFVLVIDDGTVTAPQGGDVTVAGTSFIIPDTRAKPDPPAVVRLRVDASVQAALSLLDRPPLEVMKKTGLPVDLASGSVKADGTIAFPLKKNAPIEEVRFDVAGVVTDAFTSTLVRGREMAAERLDLIASDSEISLSGTGTFDTVPVDVTWKQAIGRRGAALPGRVTAQAQITPQALDAFGIALPRGMWQGQAAAEISINLVKDTPPQLVLTSDLQGAQLAIPEVKWSKPAQADARLSLAVTLGAAPKVDAIELDGAGLFARGELSLTADQQLQRLRLNELRLGDWLDAPVDLIGRGKGVPLGVEIRGGTVDLRRAEFGSSANTTSQGSPLRIRLDRLQVTDTIAITDLRGDFSTAGGMSGQFEGDINGGASISGAVTPRSGRSAIRVQADDAGRVLAAAGVTQQARGGRVDLELVPIGTEGAFDGTLSIKDTRITEAPAIAALLNSISVVGLIDELNGDGIRFSEIDADFRLAPAQITLRQASAVGASMGLSMDGVFVPDTGSIQMQGVISPIYMVNAIGSVLTRPGEGLFGFNYSITGTTTEPEVFVNPLTALVPGMFRNIFRTAQPEVPLEDGEPEPPKRAPPVVTRGEDR